jgi:hypothetical protein
VIYVLSAVILYQLIAMILQNREHQKSKDTLIGLVKSAQDMLQQRMDRAEQERQQLLDRIQSPTFSEYKHQEAKIIKAKNGTDKPDIVIEQL